jgi:hypothetical protein
VVKDVIGNLEQKVRKRIHEICGKVVKVSLRKKMLQKYDEEYDFVTLGIC